MGTWNKNTEPNLKICDSISILIDDIILNYHFTFYAIAYANQQRIERLSEEIDRAQVGKNRKRNKNLIDVNNAKIHQSAIVTVVFCALTLESFINSIGLKNNTKTSFKKKFGNLRTAEKWVEIPKSILGQGLNTTGQPYILLEKLFKRRNELVHFESKSHRTKNLSNKDWISSNDSYEAINTVALVIKELKSLDPDMCTDWLNEAENNPYFMPIDIIEHNP